MTQEVLNNILGIIGALTGFCGLCISIYVLHKEKIKLVVFHPANAKHSSHVGFNMSYNGTDDYGAPNYKYHPYCLLLWLRIINKSKTTTTILEMSLKVPKHKESIIYSQTSDLFDIATEYSQGAEGNVKIISSSYREKTNKLPIALKPYTVNEGYFCFLDLEHVSQKPFKAILKIKTPQKITKHKLFIIPTHPKKCNISQ